MTGHDKEMLLRAADSVAKNDELTGLAAIIRRVTERQRVTDGPSEGMVRVRTAVAVSADGVWALSPFCDDDKGLSADALDRLGPSDRIAVHFIEADVPLPLASLVVATVQQSQPRNEGSGE